MLVSTFVITLVSFANAFGIEIEKFDDGVKVLLSI